MGYVYSVWNEVMGKVKGEDKKDHKQPKDLEQGLLRFRSPDSQHSLKSDDQEKTTGKSADAAKLFETFPKIPEKLGHEPFRLKFEHCTPVIRNKLLMSGIKRNDVEGLFRSNVLSTFTLGAAQVGCLALGYAAGILNVHNTLVMTGIIAQILNIVVTCVHFGTNIPNHMKVAIEVEILSTHLQRSLREEQVQYQAAVHEYSVAPGNLEASTKATGYLKCFADRSEREIQELAGTTIDCSMFTMDVKFQLRQKLRAKAVASYAATASM